MNLLQPNPETGGQPQSQAGTLERVPPLSESLRDTAIGGGGAAVRAEAMRFSYPSGSRPLEGYTIKRGVGRGGFGEVYYATSDAGKEVALKLIRRNLEIELRGVSQCLNLKHPHLVSLYDIRTDANDDRWVIMEFVSGESLDAIIERHPSGMPVEEALACFRQIAAGVAYLHDQGIVHRDLKPGNVFLDQETYKIGDYGLSKFISASRRSGQTESIGTVHYMAPEIANGRYGKEIDIYALGVVLYEMLSGRVPYEGESLGEVLMKHLTAEPDLSVLPDAYRHVVARMLCKNPDQRYHSVAEVLTDLDAGPQPVPATLVTSVAPASASISAHKKARLPGAGKEPPRQSGFLSRLKRTDRLMLASDDAVLGGVCGGFARYFDVDPVWIRIAVVAVGFASGFVPVLIPYFILMCVMPSDVEEVDSTSVMFDSARSALKSPSAANLIGGAFRMLLSLVFGLGFGLLAGGGTALAAGHMPEEIAVTIGIASGCLSAAAMATILGAHRLTWGAKIFVSLLVAAGLGVSVAAGLFLAGFVGYRNEEFVLLTSIGCGFTVAGVLIVWRLATTGGMAWRFFPPLLLGGGAGMLMGGMIEFATSQTDAAVFLGCGVGILVFGFTAAMLFLGYFSPARAEARRRRQGAETQAWQSGEVRQQEYVAKPGRTNAILIGLAVALGIIPAGLFVVRSSPAVSEAYVPLVETFDARSTANTKCDESGCTQPATAFLSRRVNLNTEYQRQHFCDAHARAAAWEAKQSGVAYEIFDISTGAPRDDLRPSGLTFQN